MLLQKHAVRKTLIFLAAFNGNIYLSAALYGIRHYRKSHDFCIPKFGFTRLVTEIMQEQGFANLRIQSNALEALQEISEATISTYFEGNRK